MIDTIDSLNSGRPQLRLSSTCLSLSYLAWPSSPPQREGIKWRRPPLMRSSCLGRHQTDSFIHAHARRQRERESRAVNGARSVDSKVQFAFFTTVGQMRSRPTSGQWSRYPSIPACVNGPVVGNVPRDKCYYVRCCGRVAAVHFRSPIPRLQ